MWSKLSLMLLFPIASFAWDGRGHYTLCDAATFLVKDSELKSFLVTRNNIMGHLCNIPDTYWKSLKNGERETGDPGHYVDLEVMKMDIKDIPANYSDIEKKFPDMNVAKSFGSNWWRADQFYRRAVESKNIADPTERIFQMMVNMGIMGHFVGDNAQPFHLTEDYDGWDSGHGGIHSYYEGQLVACFDENLLSQIVKRAKGIKLYRTNVIESMRDLAKLSFADVETIKKLDPVTQKSSVKEEKGMKIKTPAKRKAACEALPKFRQLIITNMARGSSLLAQIWDQLYIDAGKPKLSEYKSYNFPFQPDYIAPDYTKK